MDDRFDNSCGPNLHKAPTGIPGVDEITGGGIPRRWTTVVMGGPGSGKTIFGLRTLVNGAEDRGEPGIFVAFEEDARHIIENACSLWLKPSRPGTRKALLPGCSRARGIHRHRQV